ncbi:Unknown protein [Striga hermonthica]|uniref:Replication factor A C-terminal domain-containing protein n=1 Tax=Striga hermonthica TaxID=68872 RepID=A0A9N7RCL3_STRHE|nr:Unknown protein [Striga hermonthica]
MYDTISQHSAGQRFLTPKVSAVVYNNNIRGNAKILILYKTFRLYGAALKIVEDKYRVGPYDYSWTINNYSLIQPCEDTIPTQLYCSLDTESYGNLHRYADSENLQKGEQLANNINAGNVVIAMQVRVSTFYGISVSTKQPSSILINPPTPEATELKKWYLQNQLEVANLIAAKEYRNTATLLPRPPADDIISVQDFVHSNCSACNQQSEIIPRARIPIYIEDDTETIAAIVYGEDAEGLVRHAAADLKDAKDQGMSLLKRIEQRINRHHVICFVRLYQTSGTNYSIVKLYMDEIEGLLDEDDVEDSAEQKSEGESDVQLFTPTTKACLEEIENATVNTATAPSIKPMAARALKFGDSNAISPSKPPVNTTDMSASYGDEGSVSNAAALANSLKKPRTFAKLSCLGKYVHTFDCAALMPSNSVFVLCRHDVYLFNCIFSFFCECSRLSEMTTLAINEVLPHIKGWTVIIQVIERGHILTTKKNTSISYRKFVLAEVQGTKVSVAAYNNNIRPGANLLLPYKTYRVSGATVKKVEENHRVSSYDFSWTINNNTLIQPYEDVVPPQLYCHIDTEMFANLHRHADTDSLQNVLGVVVHAFESKQKGFDSVIRELVIMNAENMPMILTLWNEFAGTEGEQLATSINAGNVVIAMRVRVTTFNGISLSTKPPSAILINPATPEANEVKQWYMQNRLEVDDFIAGKAFTDTNILLLRPPVEDIVGIQTLFNPANNVRAAWIEGHITLGLVNQSLWFGACANCQKRFNLQVGSEIRCSSCDEHSQIAARARIPICIRDESGSIAAIVYGDDAEDLAGLTGADLKDAEEEGIDLVEPIATGIKNRHVVFYVRVYQANDTNYSVVKTYMDEIEDLLEEDDIDDSVAEEEPNIQLLPPNTMEYLEETASDATNTDIAGPSNPSAARAFTFGDDTTTSSSNPPVDTTCDDASYSEFGSASTSAVPSSPLKRPRN